MTGDKTPPAVWRGWMRILQAVVFGTIEVAALQHLDGWLYWALLAVVAWNVAVVVLIIHGLLNIAVQAAKTDEERAS